MQNQKSQPAAFISYAWGDVNNQQWVRHLADRITNHGIAGVPQVQVVFDQEEGYLGQSLNTRMRSMFEEATVVLAILTPDYKEKADMTYANVGFEFTLIRENK